MADIRETFGGRKCHEAVTSLNRAALPGEWSLPAEVALVIRIKHVMQSD